MSEMQQSEVNNRFDDIIIAEAARELSASETGEIAGLHPMYLKLHELGYSEADILEMLGFEEQAE